MRSLTILASTLLLTATALSSANAQSFFPSFGERTQNAPMTQEIIADDDGDASAELPARFQRQIVDYQTNERPGTVVIDTPNTYLYLVLGNGQAMRYGIGVGREGFTWAGTQTVARKAEWPDWHPPAEMIARQPYLPRFTAGGPGNPLGARAMYLGNSVYRIHGTNDPSTIGKQVSSGCIRLTNEDVSDLYSRVNVGAKVVVLPQSREANRQRNINTASTTTTVSARSSYAMETQSRAASTWATIRSPGGLY